MTLRSLFTADPVGGMSWNLPPEEPAVSSWRPSTVNGLLRAALAARGNRSRPAVLAVDGRSASGKSSLAEQLSIAAPSVHVVRTDDIAWHETLFGWGDLLEREVLRPATAGLEVTWTPSAWVEHGREGAIVVPRGTNILVVEGVGSLQRQVRSLVDLGVWVQSDHVEAAERGIARDVANGGNGDEAQAREFWDMWMAHETQFLSADRPWAAADLVVAGSVVDIQLGPDEIAVSDGPLS